MNGFVLAIFERPQRFPQQAVGHVVESLIKYGNDVGIRGWKAQDPQGREIEPVWEYLNGQRDIIPVCFFNFFFVLFFFY